MPVTIHDVVCIKETDKAILVELPDLSEPEWVPKSQIHDNSEVYRDGHSGDLVVNDWFAEKKGWSE